MNPKTVVVAGDILTDWYVIQIQRVRKKLTSWNWDNNAKIFCAHGGSALLTGIMNAVIRRESAVDKAADVRLIGPPTEQLDPADKRITQAFWQLAPFPYGKNMVWRVESFLGIEPPQEPTDTNTQQRNLDWMRADDDPPAADLVLLDDADQRFRNDENLWPQAIKEGGNCQWIILKMAHPIGKGKLFEHLLQHFAEKLIIVLTANDLRLSEVQISRELSWERTAQDLVWELTHNPNVNALTQSAHVVVSFDTAGAVLLSQRYDLPDHTPKSYLFFDPPVIEGAWQQDYPGGVFGYTS